MRVVTRPPVGTPPADQPVALSPAPKQPATPRPRRFRSFSWRLLAALVAVLVLIGLGALARTAPRATITITPAEASLQGLVTVTAEPLAPSPQQAQAHRVTATPAAQQVTVPATGKQQQAAVAGQGTLTFYNLATSAQNIAAGTVLTGADGVRVITTATAFVPAGNPPTMGSISVPAQATQTGPGGNIAALDINQLCCTSGIEVKNNQPFAQGQNARDYTVVQQRDIDGAATPLVATLTQRARTSLQELVGPNEILLPSACLPTIRANHTPGQEASQVTVAVGVSCRSETYNRREVARLATERFAQQGGASLGTAYKLSGQISAAVGPAVLQDAQRGQLAIPVTVRGRWEYQLSGPLLQRLLKHVAGMRRQAARAYLDHIQGIQDATIQSSGWETTTLPLDERQIDIKIAFPSHP